MSTEIARIMELEKALAEVISYLKRLPVHPETYRHAKQADAILSKKAGMTTMYGAMMTMTGIVAMAARLRGNTLTIKTQDVDVLPYRLGADPVEFKDRIHNALRRGVTIELEDDALISTSPLGLLCERDIFTSSVDSDHIESFHK